MNVSGLFLPESHGCVVSRTVCTEINDRTMGVNLVIDIGWKVCLWWRGVICLCKNMSGLCT